MEWQDFKGSKEATRSPNQSSISHELSFDTVTPKVYLFIPLYHLYQVAFIRFQNIMFTSSITDEPTDAQKNGQNENVMLMSASVARQRSQGHKVMQLVKECP